MKAVSRLIYPIDALVIRLLLDMRSATVTSATSTLPYRKGGRMRAMLVLASSPFGRAALSALLISAGSEFAGAADATFDGGALSAKARQIEMQIKETEATKTATARRHDAISDSANQLERRIAEMQARLEKLAAVSRHDSKPEKKSMQADGQISQIRRQISDSSAELRKARSEQGELERELKRLQSVLAEHRKEKVALDKQLASAGTEKDHKGGWKTKVKPSAGVSDAVARQHIQTLVKDNLVHPKLRNALVAMRDDDLKILKKDPMLILNRGNSVPGRPDLTYSIDPVLFAGTPGKGRPKRPPGEEEALSLISFNANSLAPSSSNKPGISYKATEQLRMSRRFYRDGFAAVGLLAEESRPFCSAVLIHRSWVLSAAHCIASVDPAGSRTSTIVNIQNATFQGLKAGEDHAYSVESDGRRLLNTTSLNSWRVKELLVHPDWKGTAERDVALIRVDENPAISESDYPGLAQWPLSSLVEVTLAGYGNTTSDYGANGGMLEIGWQFANFSHDRSSFRWHYGMDAESGASSCLMDSGGPIFRGVQQGYEGENLVLIGIISGFAKDRPGWFSWIKSERDEPCRGGEVVNVRVDAREVKSWICKNTANSVRGC